MILGKYAKTDNENEDNTKFFFKKKCAKTQHLLYVHKLWQLKLACELFDPIWVKTI